MNLFSYNLWYERQQRNSPIIPFSNRGFIFAILHLEAKVSSFINRWVKLAISLAITGAPSLRNLAEIWSIPEAMQQLSSLSYFQLMLLIHCVKQYPHIHFESAYDTEKISIKSDATNRFMDFRTFGANFIMLIFTNFVIIR